MSQLTKSEARSGSGRFQPGQSGNPAGRPKGGGRAAELRRIVEDAAPELLASLVRAANGGDTRAAMFLIDRVLPAMKPADAPVPLAFNEAGSNAERVRIALQAVADGELSLSQAEQALGLVAKADDATERAQASDRNSAVSRILGL